MFFILCSHIIADEVRGVLAVVGEVENQLERYNVKDDGALVISFTMLLDHLSAFYDGLVSHRTLLTPICARQEQAQNAAAQLRRFYVAGEVFNGPLTYPPGAEHDPSWGRLGLTPGEIYVLISGTLNLSVVVPFLVSYSNHLPAILPMPPVPEFTSYTVTTYLPVRSPGSSTWEQAVTTSTI